MPGLTYTAQQSVKVYPQPDIDTTPFAVLRAGTMIAIYDLQGDWVLAEELDRPETRGWASAKVFKPLKKLVFRRGVRRDYRGDLLELEGLPPSGPTTEEAAPDLADDAPEPEAEAEPPPQAEPEPDDELSPPRDQKIQDAETGVEKQVARVWNKYGGLLAKLANLFGIEVAAAVAVLAVESGGAAFGPQNRMIVRFENHLFHRYWGKDNQETFDQHFRFDPDVQWKGHEYRRSAQEAWQTFHGDQLKEWDVLNFARTFKGKAAKMSISMGAPQILGGNFKQVGYEDVHQMFDAFNDPVSGEKNQVLGLFRFIYNDPRNRGIPTLRNQDYRAFAEMYNGPGQAAAYGNLIADRVRVFKRLRGE